MDLHWGDGVDAQDPSVGVTAQSRSVTFDANGDDAQIRMIGGGQVFVAGQ